MWPNGWPRLLSCREGGLMPRVPSLILYRRPIELSLRTSAIIGQVALSFDHAINWTPHPTKGPKDWLAPSSDQLFFYGCSKYPFLIASHPYHNGASDPKEWEKNIPWGNILQYKLLVYAPCPMPQPSAHVVGRCRSTVTRYESEQSNGIIWIPGRYIVIRNSRILWTGFRPVFRSCTRCSPVCVSAIMSLEMHTLGIFLLKKNSTWVANHSFTSYSAWLKSPIWNSEQEDHKFMNFASSWLLIGATRNSEAMPPEASIARVFELSSSSLLLIFQSSTHEQPRVFSTLYRLSDAPTF